MMHDLAILVADKNMHFAIRGALSRPHSLGISSVTSDFIVHPNRDGGVRKTGPDLLALKRRSARHALLLLDYDGCGSSDAPEVLEADLDTRLRAIWGTQSKAIVITPELDVWMWGRDNMLKSVLGWTHSQAIRDWLSDEGFALNKENKPDRPKEAMEAVMRKLRQPRSSSLYENITTRISLAQCTDVSFQTLRGQLQRWFPRG